VAEPSTTQTLYIGSYGEAAEPTIHACRLNGGTGKLSVFQKLAGIEQASFLAVHPGGSMLYAVSETEETRGEPGGSVHALAIDPQSGELEVLGDQLTHGEHPCYVSLSPDRQSLYVANYSGGNAAVFPLEADGQLSEAASAVVSGEGDLGPAAGRQEKPHLHSVGQIPDTPYVYACDLGTDSVYVYRQSADGHSLLKQSIARLEPGTGPRHAAFLGNLPFSFVIGELDSYVNVLRINREEGTLEPVQRISALPDDFAGTSWAADIHLSPDGRYLYASNRGHDSIAVFAVNHEDGTLTAVQHCLTGGRTPRNFAISPDGEWLLAANQESGTVNVFRRDADSGKLAQTSSVLEVAAPVCIRFA
jgi:6-phosphogluconolactonase